MRKQSYLTLKKKFNKRIKWYKKRLKNNKYKTPNRIKYLNSCIDGFSKQIKRLNKQYSEGK